MATNQSQKNAAAKVFKAYPAIKEVYVTSDGQVWTEGTQGANRAKLHAKNLKVKEIATITREDVADELKALEEAAKAEAAKKLLAKQDLNYKRMTKDALLAECGKRTPDIKPDKNATNVDIIALLEADDKAKAEAGK